MTVSSQGTGIWREISPSQVSIDPNNPTNNYGFNTVVIDPTDPSILFVGTNYQGLWKSTDGGGTWAKLNTGSGGDMLDQGRVWTLAVDPFNHTTLWATAGYGPGGPLKSIDGGVSWTKVAVGSPTQSDDVYSIYLDPYTPKHMLIGWHSPWSTDNTNSGVSESLDGGTTWMNHQPPSGSAWRAGNAAWFLDNSQSWLVGSQNDGIWRTTDSGSTWAQVLTDPIDHGGVNSLVKIGSTYYLATSSSVHTSTDGGAKWTDISNGLPYGYYATIATDGTNLYTAPSFPTPSYVDGPWYYRALSGGSWQPLLTSPNTCYSDGGFTACNGPVMSAYDSLNHIGYAVNWLGGVWTVAN